MVVKDVDLVVKRGEVVGLLGPKGAGKTTTFYMITGMISPTMGSVFLDDENITKHAKISYHIFKHFCTLGRIFFR